MVFSHTGTTHVSNVHPHGILTLNGGLYFFIISHSHMIPNQMTAMRHHVSLWVVILFQKKKKKSLCVSMRETQFLFVRIEEQRPYEYFFMF